MSVCPSSWGTVNSFWPGRHGAHCCSNDQLISHGHDHPQPPPATQQTSFLHPTPPYMHFTMASIHPVGIGANAVRKIPQLQPQRIPRRISTRLRAENGNSGSNDDTAPSPSSPSSSSSDDLIARLKAAEEEAKELKQKLDAVNATTSGAATEPAATEPAKSANRIDGADLRRETLSFVDDKPRNWLSESDIEFFTGGGASCCHRFFLAVALLLALLSLSPSRHSSPGPSELEEDGSAVRTSKERRSASASIDARRSRRNPSSFALARSLVHTNRRVRRRGKTHPTRSCNGA